jgi:hypothetical protein
MTHKPLELGLGGLDSRFLSGEVLAGFIFPTEFWNSKTISNSELWL